MGVLALTKRTNSVRLVPIREEQTVLKSVSRSWLYFQKVLKTSRENTVHSKKLSDSKLPRRDSNKSSFRNLAFSSMIRCGSTGLKLVTDRAMGQLYTLHQACSSNRFPGLILSLIDGASCCGTSLRVRGGGHDL